MTAGLPPFSLFWHQCIPHNGSIVDVQVMNCFGFIIDSLVVLLQFVVLRNKNGQITVTKTDVFVIALTICFGSDRQSSGDMSEKHK
jgi:hypothetical protein